MKVLGILQARMSSSRFPHKVLQPILGEPMIYRQIERLNRAKQLDGVVVATSIDPSDDPLVEFLESKGIRYSRGSLNDVLDRFLQVMHDYEPEIVVRLTADCPLTSPNVIDQAIALFQNLGVDYVSNTLRPTYPDGLDVEVVNPAAIAWVAENSTDPHEREHVTLGIYRRAERFSLRSFEDQKSHEDLRWTVDTLEDFEFVDAVYRRLYPHKPDFEYVDVLNLLASDSSIESRLSRDAARNAALAGIDTGAMEHK